MPRTPDPVNSARARIAYHSRRDVGDPTKLPAARREFALVKLERCIDETLQVTGPLTPKECGRLIVHITESPAAEEPTSNTAA